MIYYLLIEFLNGQELDSIILQFRFMIMSIIMEDMTLISLVLLRLKLEKAQLFI